MYCDGMSRERDYVWFYDVLRPLECQMAKSLGLQVEESGCREFLLLTSLPLDHQSVKEAREPGLTAVPRVCVHVCICVTGVWQYSTIGTVCQHHPTSSFLLTPVPFSLPSPLFITSPPTGFSLLAK